jgi:arsenate reductase
MTTRILFLCTGNRARSQLAEGLARSLAKSDVEVSSAGSRPDIRGVHPLAVEVLRERGIDISTHRPKKVDELPGEFDYVITLCDDAAQDCPFLAARIERIHWGMPDPAAAMNEGEDARAVFRNARDTIETRLRDWLARLNLLRL